MHFQELNPVLVLMAPDITSWHGKEFNVMYISEMCHSLTLIVPDHHPNKYIITYTEHITQVHLFIGLPNIGNSRGRSTTFCIMARKQSVHHSNVNVLYRCLCYGSCLCSNKIAFGAELPWMRITFTST